MKLTESEDGTAEVSSGGGVKEVVVVGVRLDSLSKELLTWALMKATKPGDRVIALHVLNSTATAVEIEGGTGSLLALVKTFDSLLAVYEGFCNLKQVDLKLKVCRGESVKRILVREAKANGASKIIVGTSKNNHTIRPTTSIAKYCFKKLSKKCSVFAISNGKVIYQKEANGDPLQDGSILAKHSSSRKTVAVNSLDRVLSLSLKDGKEPGKSCLAHKVHSSRALIPFQGSDSKLTTSHSNVSGELPDHKLGWKLVRQKLTGKQDCSKRFHASKAVRKFLKLPTHNSSSVVYPDQRNSGSRSQKHKLSNLKGESSAIVAHGLKVAVAWSPVSPSFSEGLPEELNGLYEKYSSMCRWFSYEELEAATSNFAPENIIGTGGSSHVYKGLLPSGKELAVKILKPSDDVLKEFVVEIEMITTLHHKNIISLFGFCFDHSKLLLVYDFLSRGSLEENLHGNKKDVVTFGWHERHKVAVGVAEALDYLHNHCDHPVIHRDVKSSNVLLFDDFEPQLSDFGLACWMCSSTEETNSDVAGTFGYLAPEYFMHGRMSDKLDVFAFGVVLLELLSGRMAIAGPDSQGQESLLMWARPILQGGKQSQLLDPHIKTEDAEDEIERMVMAATLCIRSCPKSRPQISVILKLLQGDSEITKWGKVEMAESEVGNGSEGRRDPSNIQSHLNIALLDVQQDDSVSISEHVEVTVEDYLQGRWSRTASFD
ncbi:Protein kinase STUNTED [Linum perenne]